MSRALFHYGESARSDFEAYLEFLHTKAKFTVAEYDKHKIKNEEKFVHRRWKSIIVSGFPVKSLEMNKYNKLLIKWLMLMVV